MYALVPSLPRNKLDIGIAAAELDGSAHVSSQDSQHENPANDVLISAGSSKAFYSRTTDARTTAKSHMPLLARLTTSAAARDPMLAVKTARKFFADLRGIPPLFCYAPPVLLRGCRGRRYGCRRDGLGHLEP